MKLAVPGRRPATNANLSERDQRLTWRIAALLLDYPGEQMMALTDRLTAASMQLPEVVGVPVQNVLRHFQGTDPLDLAAQYVETFDMRRRASLHLTYYAYGDTRKRGVALLRFKHAYRLAGMQIANSELPDYLPMVLEFAATVDHAQGERLLREHVPVLELLRLSLSDNASIYANVLCAVLATLPPVSTSDRRRIAELAAQGPPEEEVGLEPYALDPLTSEGRR